MRLGPGTLYSSIQTLLEEKLIDEVGVKQDAKLGAEPGVTTGSPRLGASWRARRPSGWPVCCVWRAPRKSCGATTSEKIYAWLLRLYPAHFRRAYGEDSLQLLRDRVRDETGFLAKMRLWLDLAADLAVSVPGEHMRAAEQHSAAKNTPASRFLSSRSSPFPK